jgi:hypothetical protein
VVKWTELVGTIQLDKQAYTRTQTTLPKGYHQRDSRALASQGEG